MYHNSWCFCFLDFALMMQKGKVAVNETNATTTRHHNIDMSRFVPSARMAPTVLTKRTRAEGEFRPGSYAALDCGDFPSSQTTEPSPPLVDGAHCGGLCLLAVTALSLLCVRRAWCGLWLQR